MVNALLPTLRPVISKITSMEIPPERQELLKPLIDYIDSYQGKNVQLNFICTHNSRRSQFAQVWGQVASYYYGHKVNCYSGGTEVTAF